MAISVKGVPLKVEKYEESEDQQPLTQEAEVDTGTSKGWRACCGYGYDKETAWRQELSKRF